MANKKHLQTKSDKRFKKFIRNPKIVWYGPHPCPDCGATVVRAALEQGGKMLDAPHGHHYPNHEWKKHKCGSPVDGNVAPQPTK